MIVIYSQDKTELYNTAEEAHDRIFALYGNKVGKEAYTACLEGRDFRKYGGPLIQNVSKEKATWIMEKEQAIRGFYSM